MVHYLPRLSGSCPSGAVHCGDTFFPASPYSFRETPRRSCPHWQHLLSSLPEPQQPLSKSQLKQRRTSHPNPGAACGGGGGGGKKKPPDPEPETPQTLFSTKKKLENPPGHPGETSALRSSTPSEPLYKHGLFVLLSTPGSRGQLSLDSFFHTLDPPINLFYEISCLV